MFDQDFIWLKGKRNVIISNKHEIYELGLKGVGGGGWDNFTPPPPPRELVFPQ